jgi:GT2 family glycosyltransferase
MLAVLGGEMTPLIAVLTFNRKTLLQDLLESLDGITTKIVGAKIVVFDDCSTDGTVSWSQVGVEQRKFEFFSTPKQLGVARNSNRALRYFLDRRRFSTLFILNDDLLIKDQSVFADYIEAIEKTKYEFFCYTDERSPYKPSAEFTCKGVTLIRRRAGDGCFQVMTRKVVETLGGYDTNFGVYGGEDLDFARRAVAAGFSMDVLDVKSAQGKIVTRQYFENIQCSLGADRAKHSAIGSEYWLKTMNEDAVIWKEVTC